MIFAAFENLTLVLFWSDNDTTTVSLEDQDDCIYRGQFREDPASAVLVTGCEDEDFDVFYQSAKIGDNIFSTKGGYPVFIEVTKDELSHQEYSDDYAAHDRSRRSTDEESDDYYSDYEGVPNLNIDEQFPILDTELFEIEDVEMPEKLILNINIYLDPSWKELHKSNHYKIAKQVVAGAAELFNHPSLNTRIELIHNNRIIDSNQRMTTMEIKKIIATQLRYPWEVEGTYNTSREYKVAHVYLTTEGRGVVGRAELESICDEKIKSVSVIKWKESISRTSVTVAHEIGHVLGMWHDFGSGNKETPREKCAIKDDGKYVMNYGKVRGQWSDCTNEDFKIYYQRVYHNSPTGFCLEEAEKPSTGASKVSCGSHSAISCAACPQGHGSGWCNGDCEWNTRSSSCQEKSNRATCVWGAWSSWSTCSASCGGGSQSATRRVIQQATGGEEECRGEPEKIQKCWMTDCPVKGKCTNGSNL